MSISYLRRSSMAFCFCLSCQVGDGSTDLGAVNRPRRVVCKGESGCRTSISGSVSGAIKGISSNPLGNVGRGPPSIADTGN